MAPANGHGNRQPLLLYIHGFQGSEESFGEFPEHVQKRLHQVDSLVFPAYDCRLAIPQCAQAVLKFLSQLRPPGEHQSPLQIILLAHSMGGLVATEVIQILIQSRSGDGLETTSPMDANSNASKENVADNASHQTTSNPISQQEANQIQILGLICFDSPFFHLSPSLINLIQKPFWKLIQTATDPNASWFTRMSAVLIPTTLSIAAVSHFLPQYMDFLAPLFKESLEQRVQRIQTLLSESVYFQCYYPKVRRFISFLANWAKDPQGVVHHTLKPYFLCLTQC
jgi:pimeloyl-ACP methyl ester carboxylesterase